MMERKMIIRLGVFLAMVVYCLVAWNRAEAERMAEEDAAKERAIAEGYNPYAVAEGKKEADGMISRMIRVGIPVLVTLIYGGVLVLRYLLPAAVDRFSEEMMGSTEEMEDDPRAEARAAVAEGDYLEAVRVYREVWKTHPEERFLMTEVAKLQREKLGSPAVAVSTLEEAVAGYDWEPDDRAFLLFRMVEIYEEDLKNEGKVKEILKRVIEEVPGTRHAANAAHKLRGLESGQA